MAFKIGGFAAEYHEKKQQVTLSVTDGKITLA